LFFAYALIISLVIILLTITYHLFKAMQANPVEALKYE